MYSPLGDLKIYKEYKELFQKRINNKKNKRKPKQYVKNSSTQQI